MVASLSTPKSPLPLKTRKAISYPLEERSVSCVESLHDRLVEEAAGRKVVSLLGNFRPRKGLPDFLEMAKASSDEERLVFVGGFIDEETFSVEEQCKINELRQLPNVYCNNERIESDREFLELARYSDVPVAVYRDFRTSSNMLALASEAETPVIVAPGFLMAKRVSEFGIGRVVSGVWIAERVRELRELIGKLDEKE